MAEIPILKIGSVLLVSIQIDLEDHTAMTLQENLSSRIAESGATGVVIDISGLEIVDSFIGRMLASVASVSRILDARTVVVGMRPAVAITLVELGLSMQGVRTALTLEQGLAVLGQARPAAADSAEPADRAAAGDSAQAGDSARVAASARVADSARAADSVRGADSVRPEWAGDGAAGAEGRRLRLGSE